VSNWFFSYLERVWNCEANKSSLKGRSSDDSENYNILEMVSLVMEHNTLDPSAKMMALFSIE